MNLLRPFIDSFVGQMKIAQNTPLTPNTQQANDTYLKISLHHRIFLIKKISRVEIRLAGG